MVIKVHAGQKKEPPCSHKGREWFFEVAVTLFPDLAAGERQESHFACVLHGGCNLALLLRGQTGDTTGTDLVAVGDELTKGVDVLVVHLLDARCLQRVLLRAAGLLKADTLSNLALLQ